jgi:hypothetical protein
VTDAPSTFSELILHPTEDGRSRIEGRLSIRHAERAALEVG